VALEPGHLDDLLEPGHSAPALSAMVEVLKLAAVDDASLRASENGGGRPTTTRRS
jgi:hypothetical protein